MPWPAPMPARRRAGTYQVVYPPDPCRALPPGPCTGLFVMRIGAGICRFDAPR
ncbi:MAG: hypothetical protein LC624_10885 [Halobacteriales archaeon]|nr:hypothetical protein [Halobacteriales archaeon]